MKKLKSIIVLSACALTITAAHLNAAHAQPSSTLIKSASFPGEDPVPASKVDFAAFEKLTAEVKNYRKDRLIEWDKFKSLSKDSGVIILDTRSEAMFREMHIKGAINLSFSDFTQENLAKIIPSSAARILIYCNNNFSYPAERFAEFQSVATKSYRPVSLASIARFTKEKELTLALNIPTFINLYGYGYKNVYELAELIALPDARVELEGTKVPVGLTLSYGK